MIRDGELHEFERDVARAARSLNHRDERRAYTQVLLAHDGSADARAALERVAAVTGEGSDVTVLTVIPYEAVGSKLDPIDPDDRGWQWQCLAEATAHLRQSGIEPYIEAAAGSPAAVICETAHSLDADLVILGNQHGGRWQPSIRNNPVRRSVQKHLDCDVLVVRAERRSPRVAASRSDGQTRRAAPQAARRSQHSPANTPPLSRARGNNPDARDANAHSCSW